MATPNRLSLGTMALVCGAAGMLWHCAGERDGATPSPTSAAPSVNPGAEMSIPPPQGPTEPAAEPIVEADAGLPRVPFMLPPPPRPHIPEPPCVSCPPEGTPQAWRPMRR